MSLEFRKIGVDVVDHEARIEPQDDWVWTKVKVLFEDKAERFPGVTVAVPCTNDETLSLGAFREEAVNAAKTVLRAALDALEGGTYASLVLDHRAVDRPVHEDVPARGVSFDGGKTTFDGGNTTFD